MSELNDKLITYGNLSTFYDKLQEQGLGGVTIENVTYAQLKAKRDNSQLVKGQRYRITDYETTVQTEDGNIVSAEHPFDVIVTAIAENKLSETGVKVAHCADDDYFVAKPFRYYVDEDDSSWVYPYEGTIEIDGTTYYKWYCADTISSHAEYILTTQATYSNTPDGEDENGEYYYNVYQFAGFINDSDEEVVEYEVWQEKHKCIIKTDEIDGNMYLIIGDIFLASTETYQSQYTPKLEAWEVNYCLDNDKERFAWAQVEDEESGLGFAGIQVRGEKEVTFNKLVIGDEITPAGDDYSGEGHYYIDEGNYDYIEDGTIENDGTIYYKWYCKDKNISVLTTQSNYTNSVSGEDGDGYEYYDTVYNVVGEITIDDEEFGGLYKDYKRIIKTELETENLTGKFLYKRYEEGDTEDTFAWVYVRNSNNKSINDTNVDWDDIDTTDLLYTSSEEPAKGTETGDYEVVKYVDDIQHIYDGKGVIYYLKDEFNNEAEYDFKNVLFEKDYWTIQVTGDGQWIYRRYPEKDDKDNNTYAFAYINGSDGYNIEDIENNLWMLDNIDTNDILNFYSTNPNVGDYDTDGEWTIIDSKMISLGSKFTFGETSQNPIDDTFEGSSNNNTIESTITDGVKSIPVLDLGTDVVNYGKGGGTTYTAGDNIQINNGVISATDTKYYAGSNISINGSNQISCTYNYSLPTASVNELGGIKVGSNLDINNGVLNGNYSDVDKGIVNVDGTLQLGSDIYDLLLKIAEDNYSNLPMTSQYLTIEATQDDTTVDYINHDGYSVGIEYSTNLLEWTSVIPSANQTVHIASLNQGEKVYVRGENNNYCDTNASYRYNSFNNDKPCYYYGNIMSLIKKKGFENIVTLTEKNTFLSLFNENSNLLMNSSKYLILPATTLTERCYGEMFKGCTSLTEVPSNLLPATNLTKYCYWMMFYGCTGLTTTPLLPATNLTDANACYWRMFEGCTSLTTIPELPATTLASSCYSDMFAECTGLIDLSSKTLPATTVAGGCYTNMFNNCSNLVTPPIISATNLSNGYSAGGNGCMQQMFYNCTSLTSVPELPATTLSRNCYSSMFYGCTSLTTLPNGMLPSTNLSTACYQHMFRNCTGLTTVPNNLLPATTLAQSCYVSMFAGCSSLTTAPALPAIITKTANNNYFAYGYMFDGCTSLTTAPELNSVSLYKRTYDSMFNNCSSLAYIKCLATDISETDCTKNWLNGVAANGTFEKDASMSSWTTGTSGIPSGWTVQDYVAPSA